MSIKKKKKRKENNNSFLLISVYLEEFKASEPEAQVFGVTFFHKAEQVIIFLFFMH